MCVPDIEGSEQVGCNLLGPAPQRGLAQGAYAFCTRTHVVEWPPPKEQGGKRFPLAIGIVLLECVEHL